MSLPVPTHNRICLWFYSYQTRWSLVQASLPGGSLSWTLFLQSKTWKFVPGFYKSVLKEMRDSWSPWPPISTEIMKWVFIPMDLRVKVGWNSGSDLHCGHWQQELFLENKSWKPHSFYQWGHNKIIVLRRYMTFWPLFSRGSQGSQCRICTVRCPSFCLRINWEVFCEHSQCLGTKRSILSTQQGSRYHWSSNHHLKASS